MATCVTAANSRELAALCRELAGEGGRVYRLLCERPVSCADVRALAQEAHACGQRLVVDASEVSLAGTAAAHLGADAVVALETSADAHRASSDVALAFASYLACHPAVAELRYPGLKTDPSYQVASQVLVGGFGPLLSWRPTCDAAWELVDVRSHDVHELIASFELRLATTSALG